MTNFQIQFIQSAIKEGILLSEIYYELLLENRLIADNQNKSNSFIDRVKNRMPIVAGSVMLGRGIYKLTHPGHELKHLKDIVINNQPLITKTASSFSPKIAHGLLLTTAGSALLGYGIKKYLESPERLRGLIIKTEEKLKKAKLEKNYEKVRKLNQKLLLLKKRYQIALSRK